MREAKKLVGLTILVAVSACGKLDEKDESAEIALTTFEVQSAIGSLNGATNDTEYTPSYAYRRERTPFSKERSILDFALPKAYASACDINRFNPPIGSSDCIGTEGDKTVVSTFDSCTAGKYDQFILEGEVKLDFDSPSTCSNWVDGGALPIDGNITRTSSNFVRNNPNGSYVKVNSDEHQNYKGENVSGGVRTSFDFGSRSVDVLGLRRERIAKFGFKVFDHSVRTLDGDPIVVTGTKLAGNRTVASGTLLIDHNFAKFTTSVELTGLSWVSSCCHPVNGKIEFQRSGSKNGKLSVNFDTGSCGEALVLFESGPHEGEEKKIELYSCE